MKTSMRILVLGILLQLTYAKSYAQDSLAISQEMYNMGMELFDFETRKQATEMFIQATDFNPDFAEAQLMAGKAILMTVNKEEALPYLKKAYDLDHQVDEEILYLIGQAHQYSENFDTAIKYFTAYRKQLAQSLSFERARKIYDLDWKIYECRNAKVYLANSVDVDITNLSDNINSEYADYAPLITADEKKIIFTSRRANDNTNANVAEDFEYYEDIYYSDNVNGQWQAAKPFDSPINGNYHNSNVGLSPDGTVLYIYTDENGGDILESFFENGKWSTPKPLKGLVNTPYHENSATISNDKKSLYFTSDKPGGYGGTDIYISRIDNNGRWGKPENLGPVINTERDEEAPFISKSGLHLYFSSNGHAGMGDLDLYRAVRESKTAEFTRPVNLGYPINSVENDIFFVLNGDESQAYYSSVKSTSKGEQDIYKIDMQRWKPINLDSLLQVPKIDIETVEPTPVVVAETPVTPISEPEDTTPIAAEISLIMTILDARTLDTLEAKVVLVDQKRQTVSAGKPNAAKAYEIAFTNQDHTQYRVKIQKEGYLPYESMIHVLGVEKRTNELYETIVLNPLENTFTGIMNVFFGHDSAQPNGYEDVQYLQYLMNDNPGIKVEISGHTDNTGDATYNQQLSQRRADAIKDYLVENGIDAFRIDAVGMGMKNPIGDNNTIIGRRLNRRTEFKIIM
jgi:outer membrane protein OmpA-like peptidoglycan-associated protein/tetratricopeptide (TPR) repeat protein